MTDIQRAIAALIERRDLDADTMRAAMRQIMHGEASSAQIAGFLVAMRMKGETVTEIAAAVEVMRALATPVAVDHPHLVDTCGTGGDAAGIFNVSTAAALVVTAAGGRVAKHGNRSVSSLSGSADVLEAAGARIDLSPAQVAVCIDLVGFGFLMAPLHHGALKHAVAPRRELGTRTLFNLLGPMTNPAGAKRQVLGLFAAQWQRTVAEVLQRLGSEHVLVVHAEDGLDEFSIAAPTRVVELRNGVIREYLVAPEDLGVRRASLDSVRADGPARSLELIRQAFAGESGPAADLIAMNAGAGLYAAGLASTLGAGVARAREVLATGEAQRRLDAFVAATHEVGE
jgi:anthranilate phosphoribosyltransferase